MKTKPPFDAAQFTSTKWDTADEKAKWANAMASWATRGFPEKGWKKSLYSHLHRMFGHIAHYNQYGFYAEWFADIHLQFRWLQYAVDGGPFGGGMGDPVWTWCDVEHAFSSWIRESGLPERYQQLCREECEMKERALLAQLQRKYCPEPDSRTHADIISDPTPPTPLAVPTDASETRIPSSPLRKRRKEKKPQPQRYVQHSLFEEERTDETRDNERKDFHHDTLLTTGCPA